MLVRLIFRRLGDYACGFSSVWEQYQQSKMVLGIDNDAYFDFEW